MASVLEQVTQSHLGPTEPKTIFLPWVQTSKNILTEDLARNSCVQIYWSYASFYIKQRNRSTGLCITEFYWPNTFVAGGLEGDLKKYSYRKLNKIKISSFMTNLYMFRRLKNASDQSFRNNGISFFDSRRGQLKIFILYT